MERGVLSAAVRKRLIGALNLLASPLAGEREAAVAAVQRVVAGSGLSWEEIIPEATSALEPQQDGGLGDWRALATTLLRAHIGLFNGVEIGFLFNVPRLASLSPKQARWLRCLAERAGLAQKARRGARAA